MWEQFSDDLQKIPVPHLRALQALLFEHFGAAPSDRSYDDIPDISLYHRLITTAAIAICLARASLGEADLKTLESALKKQSTAARNNTKPYYTAQEERLLHTPIALLVRDDISGAQRFLYLLTSRGAARGLRGRSFYLQTAHRGHLRMDSAQTAPIRRRGAPPPDQPPVCGGTSTC